MTMTNDTDIEFRVPDSSSGTFEMPATAGAYIAKLNRIEHAPESQWGPQIYWYWELHNTYDGPNDVRPVAYDDKGNPWCYREKTSTKFGVQKDGSRAKSRERAEALLKREFADGESMRASELVGKAAVLHLIWKSDPVDTSKKYLNVAYIEPYRKGTLAPAPPEDGGEEGSSDDGSSWTPPF